MKRIQFFLAVIIFTISNTATAQVELIRKGQRHTRTIINHVEETEENNPLIGNWTEYKRTNTIKRNKGANVEFEDTIKLRFMPDSSVYQYFAMGKILQGDYGFEGNKFYYDQEKTFYDFTLKGDKFSIERDGNFSYFKKVDELYFPPIEKVIPKETVGKIGKLDAPFLQGKWNVYKKADPKFDRKNVYLYKLEIGVASVENVYNVTAHYDDANKLVSDIGTLIIKDNTLTLQVMNQIIGYTITKASGDEMILQDGEVVYYLKK